MIANPSYKTTGCGCGGSGSLSVAPCGCGGADCAACQGQGIVRPRFFAGQLLTEDDLQLMTDYVGYKDRLHNRHLFGAGVVCGLEVTCHPCGGGHVIVHPGYALDCCGNDLTLACAQTLDINAMIRDLRRDQLGGYDCGDPCPELGTDVVRRSPPVPSAGQAEAGTVTLPAERLRYCLYVRYCEQSSDPVMPYSTGDDCGTLSCEPTRVREGVKFELRCRPRTDAANPLIQRLCACVGDLNRFRRVLESFQSLDARTGIAQAALEHDPVFTPFVLSVDNFAVLRLAAENLGKKVDEILSLPAKSTPDFAGLTSSVRETALLLNRFNLTYPQEVRARVLEQDASGTLRPALNNAQNNISRAIALGASESAANFNDIRDWLIERLSNVPFLTDCTLRNKVLAMGQPAVSQGSPSQAKTIVGGNQPLIEVFVNYLRDCISRAVIPACTSCEDTAVLLACLEVQDCQVVRICNLERTFVLSPAAVRYWLPPLQLLGNLIERLLCDPLESLLRRPGASGLDLDNLNLGQLLGDEVKRILADSLCLLNKDKISLLSKGVDNLLDKTAERRRQVAFRDSRGQPENTSAGINVGDVAKNQEGFEKTTEVKVAGDVREVKATRFAPKKVTRRKSKKDDETSTANTKATKPAETTQAAGETSELKTNGGKTNGSVTNGKTNGPKGDQK